MADMRPHIVIVLTAYRPLVGGAEIAVEEIVRRLTKNFSFTIVTPRLSVSVARHEIDAHGIEIIRVGWGCRLDKLWLMAYMPIIAARVRRARNTQLMWAVMASYAGAAARHAYAWTGLPYVLTLQEGDDLATIDHRTRRVRWLFDKIFSGARAVQAIAPFLAVWAESHGARAPITVVPNGVSNTSFHMSIDERMRWRAEVRSLLNIDANEFVILSVSRLVKKNGVGDLIDATARIPRAHLIIVGTGVLAQELHDRARIAPERIHFVGAQPQQELKRFAAAADIFCRASWSEGMGIVFLEAMALGLPVVATRVGGIPSFITDHETGMLVSPRDVPALAHALELVVTDAALRSKLIQVGRACVQTHDWDVLAPQIGAWLSAQLV